MLSWSKKLSIHTLSPHNPANKIAQEFSKKYNIIGLDKGLFEAFQSAHTIAAYNINVLLNGDTGTGKELFADLIHTLSPYSGGHIVKINCAALPESLLESELFGYEKGSYTGALKSKQGKIELAHNGTLFLDEIAEMKLDLQAKLLRVLQTKEISRIGSMHSRFINFRLITATNKNLQHAVTDQIFREDLYYRINTFPIRLPPLRERKSDIQALASFFCRRICSKTNLEPRNLTEEALHELINHSWPGNIRELENILFQALIFAQKGRNISRSIIQNLLETGSKQSYFEAIEKIMYTIISERIDLKQINKDLVNALLKHYDNNVSLIQQKTGLSKDRIYRYKKMP